MTMKIIVQKFGGTSVRDEASSKHAMNHIKKALEDGYKVVSCCICNGTKR